MSASPVSSTAYARARPKHPSRVRKGNLVTVRIVVNPTGDVAFRQRAEAMAAVAETPEELERLMRMEYRLARVVRGVTDIFERWYVYRDGRWVNSDD